MKGMILDDIYELVVTPVRDASGRIVSGVIVGEITNQVAALVLQVSQGQVKGDLLLGAGLTNYVRGKESRSEIMQRIRVHLTRAGINWSEYKNRIGLNINN